MELIHETLGSICVVTVVILSFIASSQLKHNPRHLLRVSEVESVLFQVANVVVGTQPYDPVFVLILNIKVLFAPLAVKKIVNLCLVASLKLGHLHVWKKVREIAHLGSVKVDQAVQLGLVESCGTIRSIMVALNEVPLFVHLLNALLILQQSQVFGDYCYVWRHVFEDLGKVACFHLLYGAPVGVVVVVLAIIHLVETTD